jgi:hypothetical protein
MMGMLDDPEASDYERDGWTELDGSEGSERYVNQGLFNTVGGSVFEAIKRTIAQANRQSGRSVPSFAGGAKVRDRQQLALAIEGLRAWYDEHGHLLPPSGPG